MKYSFLILLVGSLTLTACFNDLNVEPADPNVNLADDFYLQEGAYEEGLAGVYANFSLTGTAGPGSSNIAGLDAGTSQYGRGLWNLQELTSDGAIWTWENDPGLRELNRNTWTAENVILRGMFGRVMTGVAFANEYLRQTTTAVLDSRGVDAGQRGQIAEYRAEARFVRALCYWHMMDLFGKAPMITDEDPVGAFQAPQANRAQLFAYIESELLDITDGDGDEQLAAPLSVDYGHADQAAAWMLLAKIYLNAEVYINESHYEDVIDYTDRILQSSYGLATNYSDIFGADNHVAARNEIIFPFISDGITTQNYGPTTVMVNGQVGSSEANGEDFGVGAGGWGGALRLPEQASMVFVNGTYDTDDRNTLILSNPDRTIAVPDISNRSAGYIIGKFSNLSSTGTPGPSQTFVDADFPLFRVADAHLMYAEAFLRGGGGTETRAIQLLNDLRIRANNPTGVSAADLSLDFILDERMIELHWEAHRRTDLIRFNRYTGSAYNWSWKGNVANGIGIGTFRAVYPVPAASLAANLNLEQNAGY